MKIRMFGLVVVLFSIACVCGCRSDYGVTRSNQSEWLKKYAQNPLSNNELSFRVKNFLVRENYIDEYHEHPEALLKKLNLRFKQTDNPLVLLTLAELCYATGKQKTHLDALSYFFSCAIYSSLFINDHRSITETNKFSPYFFYACLLYNYASAKILKLIEQEKLPLDRKWDLPVIAGTLVVNPATSDLPLPFKDYQKFLSCYDYMQFGFHSYSRSPGMGVPLIALSLGKSNLSGKSTKQASRIFEQSGIPCPATLFLRISQAGKSGSRYTATPEFHDPFLGDTLTINGQSAAMDVDFTTPLAYMANKGEVYSGFSALQNSRNMKLPEGLYFLTPYKQNRIPIVFVHGLMSNPRTWIQMTNTLLGNKTIREKYQFWYYAYPTGLPVLYSARKFRSTLLEAQRKFDPQHNSPTFNRMIIIGHSMGGLLAQTTGLDTGNKIVEALFDKDIKDMDITPEHKQLLTKVLCFKPLPFVSEIVFMSTPHLGAKMVEWSITQFANSFITLPTTLVEKMTAINHKILWKVGLMNDDDMLAKITGVNSLAPSNKSLKAMNKMPMQVKFHSIIGDNEQAGKVGGSDGIVAYRSAHLDGAASEVIIKSGHNTQATAEGIKAVRRILLAHLKTTGKHYK